MRNRRLEERLRTALSYRDKAAAAWNSARERLARRECSAQEYGILQERCEVWSREADGLLRGARAEVVAQAERLGAQLRAALREAGRTSGRRRRRAEARVVPLRSKIAYYNRLLKEDSPAALGGFVEMPMEAYGRAIQSPPAEFGLTRTNLILAGVAAVALVFAVVITYLITGPADGLSVRAVRVPGEADILLLQCRNEGAQALTLFIPWGAEQHRDTDNSYGVDLFARDSQSGEERLWRDSGAAWLADGRPMRGRESVTILPRLESELRLDLAYARKSQSAAAAIRVAVTDADGGIVFSAEY